MFVFGKPEHLKRHKSSVAPSAVKKGGSILIDSSFKNWRI